MLSKAPVTTMLPVGDLDRARHFYEDQLGLQPIGAAPDGAFRYRCGNAVVALLPRPGMTPSQYTAMSFEVDDIESELAELESHGVRFEDYDTPDMRTVNHIWANGSEKAAWFKDTEGNYLCIHQTLH